MSTFGNILWLLLGGIVLSVLYFISSLILMITIIGIPFGLQTMKIARLALLPFGRDVSFMNILWVFFGGAYIAVLHLVLGIIFAITIVGIPFATQHFKLMKIALVPFGQEITIA
jgi:uncharacterized membrane protein YccF (DUF307 family)